MHYAASKLSTNSDFQKAYHEVFKSKPMRALMEKVPIVYTLDDHDAGSNNANGNDASTAEANIAYRAVFPHFPIPQ